ncbi:MAG: DUF3747 domain-containing protein [Oscillatoriales cyanobacterium]|nr:MAG: DUF3747 domain-containing protein [Oscillatoriales cyanobacterium]
MKAYFGWLALLLGLGWQMAIAPDPTKAQTTSPIAPIPQASPFGQQEVDQSKFVAIAQPLGSDSHKLLVLEQISNRRLCWSETGRYPTQIDPLLVTFNFTGICGRSIDSNGFSIRVAGNDLALQYSLRLSRRFNSVVLQGTPFSTGQGPAMDIATTGGFTSGFLKLQLFPGWRFTKRTYNGRPLPHFYFTNDSYDSAITPK